MSKMVELKAKQDKCNTQQQENVNFDWNQYLKIVSNEVSLDISKQGITRIPDEFCIKWPNLQYLYLEGNELTELNTALFPSLRQLRWLDVRNNKLTTVPNSVVDHPTLEVLLLEGNNIKELPVEIGSLAFLRGIQLARNPIIFPPEDVINQGVQNTIDFLRKQWQQLQSPQHMQLISESHSQSKSKPFIIKKQKTGTCKSAVALKVNSHEPCKPRKVQSGLCAAGLSKCISVRPISRHNQEVAVEQMFSTMNYEKKTSVPNQEPKISLHHNPTKRKSSEEVKPRLLRDIWIEKIRQVLMAQETILQRRKNEEALKQWQDEAKMHQQTHSKRDSSADISFPYDTDPEYLKMLSRKDLSEGGQTRRDSSLHHIRHEEPINSKILSIMAALQDLQMSQSAESVSPRSEQKVLAQEIKKIKEIQRSLSALKLKNFGHLGLLS